MPLELLRLAWLEATIEERRIFKAEIDGTKGGKVTILRPESN